ncbi:MAG: winged helix-turn-helix transcriptional regulator [Vicinamibacterales bacterium]
MIERQLCPRFHRAVELIGRRWNGAIVFVLLQDPARFGELRASIPGITDRMLTERLQALEREGIVARTVIPETPVRIEYSLTRKGRALGETFKTISSWGERWLDAEAGGAAPRRRGRGRRSAGA